MNKYAVGGGFDRYVQNRRFQVAARVRRFRLRVSLIYTFFLQRSRLNSR